MRLPAGDHRSGKKRLEDGSDAPLNLMYYLFHSGRLSIDGRLLAEDRGWQALASALASYELEHGGPPAGCPLAGR